MAGPVDLLFARPPLTGKPVNLVFGESTETPADFDVALAGVLPALTGTVTLGLRTDVALVGSLPTLAGSVNIATLVDVNIVGTFPPLTGALAAQYISGAARPTVNETIGAWEVAIHGEVGVQDAMQHSAPTPVYAGAAWERALPLGQAASSLHQQSDPSQRASSRSGFQQADQLSGTAAQVRQQDTIHIRRAAESLFQGAEQLRAGGAKVRHQDAFRDRRNRTAAHWQKAAPHSVQLVGRSGPALMLNTGWRARYQDAMRPRPGTSPSVPPEVPDPCYSPPPGDAVHLAFLDPWTDSTDLVFVCEKHGPGPDPVETVVVPVKGVYVVLNTSSLRRVDNNVQLPILGMSMSLDVESWTWSFSASLPGIALADLQPSSPGEPILVEAMVNGVAYRLQVERRGRDRSFGSDSIKISGRGVAAVLDSPYSPILNHSNSEARTAQQLMNDVLTLNGVGIGWDIDYQAVDWSVPAGVFAHQGSYIDAVNVIASAAGSYIQPHPTQQLLRVLPRYPTLPWTWGSVTPDYEIPSAVATVEGIEWVDKAVYNRVFVSGVQDGVLGRVTRAGTDGGLVAPMVTDPLITTAAAARQRGEIVLADTGSQANVSLRMPVLEETGIIVPGKMVRYVDGGTTHRGIARSVSVEVGRPEIWQTVVLETHVI